MSKNLVRENVPLSRFGVLVAQLESIGASASQQSPDPLLSFDLLSAIDEEPQESILLWQRKCEDALYSLLKLGSRRPVRHLASVAMAKIISRGDSISIYSRASSLQGFLSDAKRSEPQRVAGAVRCLGELYQHFGRKITSGLPETTIIASKLMKFHEDFVRQEALLMLEKALEGSGGSAASTAYIEAFRLITRIAIGDKSFVVRIAGARCLKALEDPVLLVRDAFSEALGSLLALGMNPEAQVQPRGKGPFPPAKKLEGGLQRHLALPFTKVSGTRLKDVRIGITLSWVYFLQAIRLKYLHPDSELQQYALQVMEMLRPDTSVDAHALACILYILRVGVTDQMTEPTQRGFLVFLGKQLESSDVTPSMKIAALHPTCVGGLISYVVTTLSASRDNVSFEKNLKIELDSLNGQTTVLAALVSISPKLPLGYPARLPRSVLELSKKMLTESSRNPVAAIVEKEAGWLLLSSLLSSMPKQGVIRASVAQHQNASPMKTMASLEIKLPVPKDSQTSSTSTLPIEGSRQTKKLLPPSSPVHFDQDSMEDDQEDEDDWDAFQSFPVSTDAAESAAEKPDLVEKSISEREFQGLPTSKSVNNESDMSNAEIQEVISNDLGHDIKPELYNEEEEGVTSNHKNVKISTDLNEAPGHKDEEGAVSSQENIETSPDLKVMENTEGSIQVDIMEDYAQTTHSPRNSIDHQLQVSPDDFQRVEVKEQVEENIVQSHDQLKVPPDQQNVVPGSLDALPAELLSEHETEGEAEQKAC
uniref:Uncharacterized protein n=1 Tax=Salix viminalis TaxID=40686 RepID=A0A6N2MQ76_SALVM